jgi:branched-chain amino acid transport system permease protein
MARLVRATCRGPAGGPDKPGHDEVTLTRWRNMPLIAAAIIAVFVAGECCRTFYVTLFGYVGLATLVALGLVLLTGISGQTSFGQATFVGLAAYTTTLLTRYGARRRSPGLFAGLAVTGTIAWLLGLITARLSGHFLALVSVAWGISFFSLFGTLPLLHGFNGIGDIPPLRVGPLSAENPRVNLGVIWAVTAIVMAISANLLDSRMGRAIRTLNGARLMGESVGIDTVRLSRTVFVIAALYAGIAGFLFAHFQRFISPTPFGLGASIDYLFMVIIGGSESLWGAPLGAALVVVLRDQFNDWIPRITGRAGDFEALVFSLVVIVLLQRAPSGLLPLLARLNAPSRASDGTIEDTQKEPPKPAIVRTGGPGMAGPAVELLSLEAVSRNFGGLAAARDVSFAVHASEIVALIGPNGAGKTTLFNLISGVLPPSSGTHPPVRRACREFAAAAVAALGIARTFQHVKLLPARSVLENIALGRICRGRPVCCARCCGWIAPRKRGCSPRPARRPSASGFARCWTCRRAICRWVSSAWWRSPALCACARVCCCWTNPPPGCGCRKSSSRRAAAAASRGGHGRAAGGARHGLRHAARRSRRGDGFRSENRRGPAGTGAVRSGRHGSLSWRRGMTRDVTEPLLRLDGLRAGYGHVEVLHGVSLSVREGQIVAIVGPNGAGKTTLMGAVMGLLPRRGGTVRYLGAQAGDDRGAGRGGRRAGAGTARAVHRHERRGQSAARLLPAPARG